MEMGSHSGTVLGDMPASYFPEGFGASLDSCWSTGPQLCCLSAFDIHARVQGVKPRVEREFFPGHFPQVLNLGDVSE